jgi:pSer/pThr/pTyr-binding forkhead associated (FHA) protein
VPALGGLLMATDDDVQTPTHAIHLDLLDPTYEKPVKSWSFPDRTVITIGRSEGQDVEVNDVYVSRCHARIELREDRWTLVSLGRNGVLSDNKLASDLVLKNGAKFRLGSNGPFLRFRTSGKTESMHTVCFDTLPAPIFQIDETKVKDEVIQIAEGDYFQSLKDKARQLRQQRNPV